MWARAVCAKGWKDLKAEAGEEKKAQSEWGACSQVWRAAPCGGCWAVPLHFLQPEMKMRVIFPNNGAKDVSPFWKALLYQQ